MHIIIKSCTVHTFIEHTAEPYCVTYYAVALALNLKAATALWHIYVLCLWMELMFQPQNFIFTA